MQTIDLAPTVLDFFGMEIPEDMTGKPLKGVIEKDEAVRQYAIFGFHAGSLDITDGRYKLMMVPRAGVQLYEYTLMPTHMRMRFTVEELREAKLAEPFSFTKGCKVLKVPCKTKHRKRNSLRQGLGFVLFQSVRELLPARVTSTVQVSPSVQTSSVRTSPTPRPALAFSRSQMLFSSTSPARVSTSPGRMPWA